MPESRSHGAPYREPSTPGEVMEITVAYRCGHTRRELLRVERIEVWPDGRTRYPIVGCPCGEPGFLLGAVTRKETT